MFQDRCYLFVIEGVLAKMPVKSMHNTIKNAYTNEILPYCLRNIMWEMYSGKPILFIDRLQPGQTSTKFHYSGVTDSYFKIIPLEEIIDDDLPLIHSLSFALDSI